MAVADQGPREAYGIDDPYDVSGATPSPVGARILGGMSARREELHHLVDELAAAEVRPVPELIQLLADADHGVRDLPFFASFASDPDLAERPDEILPAELGR
jgi:hypothetical protein